MPLGRVLSLLSAQPAALLGLKGRGSLAVGSFADMVVFDPKAEWTYRAAESKSKSRNTPSTVGRCKAKSAGRSAKDGSPTTRKPRRSPQMEAQALILRPGFQKNTRICYTWI